MAELFVARKGFSTTRRDRRVIVQRGDIAEAGSWVLDHNAAAFDPVDIRFPAPSSSSSSSSSSTRRSRGKGDDE